MPKSLLLRLASVFALTLPFVGCTVHSTDTPELSGPSEFAQSFKITATPDAINQDGGSQSSVAVNAFDANGRPKSGVTFRLDMRVNGEVGDYGTLSFKNIVTNGEGRASSVYTAPPAPPVGSSTPTCRAQSTVTVPGACVEIVATPIGTDFAGANTQSVDIRLMPTGVIIPPAGTPTASFTFTPSAPAANSPVQFDASGSTSPNGTIVGYTWDFGDGGTGTGRTASHSFRNQQPYSVTLTVTTDRGGTASATKTVTVGAGNGPTANFVFSPNAPTVKAQVFFDASDSRPGAGHTIVSYQWNFGDGDVSSASGSPLQDHDFLTGGSFKVLLTVTDEAGQIGTVSKDVAVISGLPSATFFYTKDAVTPTLVHVDASGSTATGTATITTYVWSWGDGGPDTTTTGPTSSHTFTASATPYSIRVTITDSLGRTATSSPQGVTVP